MQVRPDATSAAVPEGAVGREGRLVRLVRRQDVRQEGEQSLLVPHSPDKLSLPSAFKIPSVLTFS